MDGGPDDVPSTLVPDFSFLEDDDEATTIGQDASVRTAALALQDLEFEEHAGGALGGGLPTSGPVGRPSHPLGGLGAVGLGGAGAVGSSVGGVGSVGGGTAAVGTSVGAVGGGVAVGGMGGGVPPSPGTLSENLHDQQQYAAQFARQFAAASALPLPMGVAPLPKAPPESLGLDLMASPAGRGGNGVGGAAGTAAGMAAGAAASATAAGAPPVADASPQGNGARDEKADAEADAEADADVDDGGDEDKTSEVAALPEWACEYCGVHDPSCVVRDNKDGKWFCNGRGSLAGSHIITHLVRSRHREVTLHRDSPLGETVLECYNCGTRNVFLLGFVPASGDSVVVLLCREPCLHAKGLEDMNWALDKWKALVADRSFLPWLVKEPSQRDVDRARHVTSSQVARLEELWKTRPDATLEEALAPCVEEGAAPALARYDDGYHYKSRLAPLVQLEADNDKSLKEEQSRSGVSVRWDVGLNKRRVAFFVLPVSSTDGSLKLLHGDEVRLRHPATGWDAVGNVKGFTAAEEVALELRSGKSASRAPTDTLTGFAVDVVWKATPFDRMVSALRTFALDNTSVSGYLFHCILGHDVAPQTLKMKMPRDISAPGQPSLNPSQVEAVRAVLQSPLSLIQGPPGTGKTVTSATIVYHLAHSGKGPVLVTAPSNVAVDQLASKAATMGLKVVRLVARSREALTSPVEPLTLHSQVKALNGDRADSELNKLLRLREEIGELTERDDRRLRSLKRSAEKELLSAADVVCATCVSSGDQRLRSLRFRMVLVDEATQSTEPEVLIPITHGCKQLVLIGDQCQLGPVVTAKAAAKAGLGQSLFERFVSLGVRPHRLTVQYRMHPCLSEFPSNTFYEGSLQNGVTATDRRGGVGHFPWPCPSRPMAFWVQNTGEEVSASGTSFLNRGEATAVERAVTQLLRAGVVPERIGVVTPYEGQRAFTVAHFARAGPLRQELYRAVEVASVDAFQGREKDYIILSCVRSNEHQGIGFLADPRRLNVALTRARLGLLIVGNPKVLARQSLWALLLAHYKTMDVLVEGSLNNLKVSPIALPRPRRYGAGRSDYARRIPLTVAPVSRPGAAATPTTAAAAAPDNNTRQPRSSSASLVAAAHNSVPPVAPAYAPPAGPLPVTAATSDGAAVSVPRAGAPNVGLIGDGRLGAHHHPVSRVALPSMGVSGGYGGQLLGSLFGVPPAGPPAGAPHPPSMSPLVPPPAIPGAAGVPSTSVPLGSIFASAARLGALQGSGAEHDGVNGNSYAGDFSYHAPGWK